MKTNQKNMKATFLPTSEEVDHLRQFHDGPMERCPTCGRKTFQPCLACRMGSLIRLNGKKRKTDVSLERSGNEPRRYGNVRRKKHTTPQEPEILRVQLQGDERQRYEYFHLEKVAEQARRENREETASFS